MLIYQLFIFLYSVGTRLAAIWNPKARAWINGRVGLMKKIEGSLEGNEGKKRIWMHCASLGEFEQGRPLLESLRKEYPQSFILLTFFSPSGYEIRKDYPIADYVSYLPPDSLLNVSRFIEIVNPDLAIFVKYEYWLNYLRIIRKKGIHLIMISAIFLPDYVFFKWYGGIWRNSLSSINHYFVQNVYSGQLIASLGIRNYSITGDTRFDRVISISENFQEIPLIKSFCGSGFVVVAGSTWPEDEEVWSHLANSRNDVKFIIAPHELYEDHLRSIEKLFHHMIYYSELEGGISAGDANVLVIDNFGLLSRLYYYAHISYIGGGFGNGIHNILEAAVYGKPLIFGPVFQKFQEANDLLESGGAETVESAIELEKIFGQLYGNHKEREERGKESADYVHKKAGATGKIMQYIQENRLLTS
jgi:3-deoxy-D-manno-octulosonic-acid transferase